MRIQPITAEHLATSLTLITTAFATAEHADGQEAALTERLRASATYRPDYDIIALSDDGQLIGSALLAYLEAQAKARGCRGISILGDPAYYSRFSYQPAADWQILPPAGIPSEFFLFKALASNQMAGVSGALSYDPAFGL